MEMMNRVLSANSAVGDFIGSLEYWTSFCDFKASRKVCRRLGVLSPAREANKTMPKLTPLEDFKICAGRFNGKERRYLKSDSQKIIFSAFRNILVSLVFRSTRIS
uniref:Uncharacterized protein n=1 Tax=Ditylenchus dipsaci TaxID=166011 RepID=A0A915DIU0_9BILA